MTRHEPVNNPNSHSPSPPQSIQSAISTLHLHHEPKQLDSDCLKQPNSVPSSSGSSPELSSTPAGTCDHILASTVQNWDQLSVYERKASLIDYELDLLGMGRYQWYIFSLCGFGFFLDLMWAHGFAIIAAPLEQEFGLKESEIGHLFTSFAVGLTSGAFVWGLLVDIIGRKWCFNLTCLISSTFGLVLPIFGNFEAIVFFTALVGTGVGGNIPVDATITLEFLPTNRRSLLATLSVFQPIGVVFASILGLAYVPRFSCAEGIPSCSLGPGHGAGCCHRSENYGWRYLMWTIGATTMAVFLGRILLFKFQESPKFLVSKGKDQEALKVLYSIAAFNNQPVPSLTLKDLEALDPPKSKSILSEPKQTWTHKADHLKGLFKNKVVGITTLLLSLAFMADFWAFSIAGQFLPMVLAKKGSSSNVSRQMTYINYIIIYSCGIPAALFATVLIDIPAVGRKWGMVLSAFAMGVSLCLYAVVGDLRTEVALNALEYFFQTLLNAILYAFTPEAFPGPIRGSACGLTSTLGRLSSIIAPIAVSTVIDHSTNAVLYLAGGGAFVAGLALAGLPFETRGRAVF
ncbi:hypothetical protein CROQUDRAFT_53357 [Cronartium quercuum f. sp. fusiforme G11]|uniref:Major facilitator superfamily (MFS) profile domain-containing protein n=1 Tax=Cronartium quercuum f. sp. fusiforme G11 TaxID=708437 RepID=A0A9P6NAU3_9BASI|nr:hypothetical protein CROQUDRAFT_53357 [Cronartium quercuum f. sp. fusiforme G11]